jgi:hypothetical protein
MLFDWMYAQTHTLILLTIVGIIFIRHRRSLNRAHKRRESFRNGAAANDWTYAPTDPKVLSEFVALGGIFSLGQKRRVRNVVTGTHDGRDFVAFDYIYTTVTRSNGKKRTRTHPHGIVALALDAQGTFPTLSVTPEGTMGRFTGAIANTDIKFESDDFNRAFTVNCDDRKFASDVLHPRAMEVLLAYPQVGWNFHDKYLVGATFGTFSFEDIAERLIAFDALLDTVPAFVWNDPAYQSTPLTESGAPEHNRGCLDA